MADARTNLLGALLNIVAYICPLAFFLENVKDFLRDPSIVGEAVKTRAAHLRVLR